MKDITSRIGIAIFAIAFLFVGLKGCIGTVWISPKTPEIYSIQGQDDRTMSMVFLPKNETIIWYFDPAKELGEGVLTKMRGSYGTHYFWRLWHIEGPGIMFGYRIFPTDTEPVNMEITVLEKFTGDRGNSSFPEKGERTYQLLLFGKDLVKFQGMWFQREPNDPKWIEVLLAMFGGSKEE